MPELPEVETVRSGIEPHINQQIIRKVIVRDKRLRWPVPDKLTSLTKQQAITAVRRRSKYLLLDLAQGQLIIHLGMSGKLTIANCKTETKKHDHVDICFENGVILRYNDPRRFGAILWSDEPNQHPRLQNLGPEPLGRSFNNRYLHDQCQKRSKSIKSTIMDASIVVGVGNIYANEALFHSGIHPSTTSKDLTSKQTDLLCKHIKSTLKRAIKAGGTTLKNFSQSDGKPGYFQQMLWVYGRNNQACHQCDTPIQRATQHQRASFFCPKCQPKH